MPLQAVWMPLTVISWSIGMGSALAGQMKPRRAPVAMAATAQCTNFMESLRLLENTTIAPHMLNAAARFWCHRDLQKGAAPTAAARNFKVLVPRPEDADRPGASCMGESRKLRMAVKGACDARPSPDAAVRQLLQNPPCCGTARHCPYAQGLSAACRADPQTGIPF